MTRSRSDDLTSKTATDHAMQAPPMPRKGSRRLWVIDHIVEALTSGDIYHYIQYRHESEHGLKQAMYLTFRPKMAAIYREMRPDLTKESIVAHADRSLMWEGGPHTTIHNVTVMGVQHRPDFLIDMKKDLDLRVAVEVKKGESGAAIREGIGQSLIYAAAARYDFVVYLFADTSKDGKIRRAVNEGEAHGSDIDPRSQWLIKMLWERFNVRFVVV